MDTNHSRITQAFAERYGEAPAFVVRAPGRVNLIGEHTDYNDGFVLPLAIERAVWIALRPRADRTVRVWSMEYEEESSFVLGSLERGEDSWVEYLKGCASVLAEAGLETGGWEGVLTGDVPLGAGLSSSAALELATLRAFAAVANIPWNAAEMALLGQKAENRWVGVNCGIMDQMISAAGRDGHALLIDCRSLDLEPVPLPEDTVVVILDTATRRGLVDSAYNERRQRCEEAARALGVDALRDVSPERLASESDRLDPTTLRRARHVVTENARTVLAAEAMRQGSPERLGTLMNESHVSLRDDFEVSTKALDLFSELARSSPGCFGARMTGAGFGGCAVALVDAGAADAFVERVGLAYETKTGLKPAIYVTRATEGAQLVESRRSADAPTGAWTPLAVYAHVDAGGTPSEAPAAQPATLTPAKGVPTVTRTSAGLIIDGREVELYTLTPGSGLELTLMTYGGIVQSIHAPDRDGRLADVTLGYASPWEYLHNPAYFGAIVGRYANRIAGGRFELDGQLMQLHLNDGPNQLHGGPRGFDAVIWNAAAFEREHECGAVLTYHSPHGEGGFPGSLDVEVTYTVTDRNEWIVDYRAATDRATPVNLSQHSYFNLAGAGSALDHLLHVAASTYLPVRPDGIPTGAPAPVEGTPFDLRTDRALREGIASNHPDIQAVAGYDHSLILDGEAASPAARLYDPGSGRTLSVFTSEPAIQVYTGNHLTGTPGKTGQDYQAFDGLCLETQHLPDSPNRPDFPDTILRPGTPYTSRTRFVFGTDTDGQELGGREANAAPGLTT